MNIIGCVLLQLLWELVLVIVHCYVPKEISSMQDKDTFYEQLNAVEERVAKVDIVIVVDDLMPRYGSTVLLTGTMVTL